MSTTTHHELPSGTLLHNRYRIESVIGQGGFGITYKALDQTLSRPVCIKELFLSGHSTRGAGNTVQSQGLKDLNFAHFCERFIEEAGALARFRHPGIVQVLDVFRENGTAYSVMEYIKGETLKYKIQREGRMPLTKALPLMQAVLDATEEVHLQGMLHRDIKPDNIMLREDDSPVLIDFGSARAFSDAKTITQTAILTPGYAPPEQYSEKARRGPFTDIYSLGATFYFMLAGVRPLPATERQLETLQAPHRIQPEIPVTLSSALMLALNIKPEERFASIEQFRRAISPNTQTNEPVRPLRKHVNVYRVFGVLLILGVLGYTYWKTSYSVANDKNILIKNESFFSTVDTMSKLPEASSTQQSEPSKETTSHTEPTQQITAHQSEIVKTLPETTQTTHVTPTPTLSAHTNEPEIANAENTEPVNPILKRLLNKMIYVQGGSFIMGCTEGQTEECYENERPAHIVQVGNFQIGKFEVTQEEWNAIMGNNPSRVPNCPNCPVESVSWNDIQEFIRALNNQTGRHFRLPTEAEWEFAARGGIKTRDFKFSGSDDIEIVGWYQGRSGRRPHPVGQKAPNELGLYDMTGNVWEWCSDWYGQNIYNAYLGSNPRGPGSGSHRVLRGGSWLASPKLCRVSYRFSNTPGNRDGYFGFRLVL